MVLQLLELCRKLRALCLELSQLLVELGQFRLLLLLFLEELVHFGRLLLILFICQVLSIFDHFKQMLNLLAVMVVDALDLGGCLLCFCNLFVTSLDLTGQAIGSQDLLLESQYLLPVVLENLLYEEFAVANFANVASQSICALWKGAPLCTAPRAVCLGAELATDNNMRIKTRTKIQNE